MLNRRLIHWRSTLALVSPSDNTRLYVNMERGEWNSQKAAKVINKVITTMVINPLDDPT